MLAGIVDEVRVGRQLIGGVLVRRGRAVEQRLQAGRLAVVGHGIGDDAAGGELYLRDEVDPVSSASQRWRVRRVRRRAGGAGGHGAARAAGRATLRHRRPPN